MTRSSTAMTSTGRVVAPIPENAPFTPEQRAWLNGFFAGLIGAGGMVSNGALAGALAEMGTAPTAGETGPAPAVNDDDEDYPWHDATVAIGARMRLAEGKRYELKLYAAMGQQDCGQCGYLCKSYAEAIASGAEQDLTLCVPGGKDTRKMLKELVSNAELAPAAKPAAAATGQVASMYTRKHPYTARLKSVTPLNGTGSVKNTRHVVIDLDGSGLYYEPGDALGIFPHNDPVLADAVLSALGATGEESVTVGGQSLRARTALTTELDITKPSDECLELLAISAGDTGDIQALQALAQEGVDEGMDLVEILTRFPSARPPVAQLTGALGKLQPRLYSIASSQAARPREVHLTVAVLRYERERRQRGGVASTFFADRCRPDTPLRIYVQHAEGFRLPEDPSTPIIMIGPGTGVAPFRAFLEERAARGLHGPAWLFFGNPNSEQDFLYRQELEGYIRTGTLTRLDTAFSRDQVDKVYVQHRMVENAADIWKWLQKGGCFYVCGDAKRMAGDVDAALKHIISSEGVMSQERAEGYVKNMVKDKRYLRDVY
jgi:sulfite reductase (NADPH) flavoprotein alpha-component